ncbi:MAG: hypothetical protein M1833_004277 [Piccolia ochrophora]|nr:MAG: hypothetical protein M1833_004277 [Piccolia ochrophora]
MLIPKDSPFVIRRTFTELVRNLFGHVPELESFEAQGAIPSFLSEDRIHDMTYLIQNDHLKAHQEVGLVSTVFQLANGDAVDGREKGGPSRECSRLQNQQIISKAFGVPHAAIYKRLLERDANIPTELYSVLWLVCDDIPPDLTLKASGRSAFERIAEHAPIAKFEQLVIDVRRLKADFNEESKHISDDLWLLYGFHKNLHSNVELCNELQGWFEHYSNRHQKSLRNLPRISHPVQIFFYLNTQVALQDLLSKPTRQATSGWSLEDAIRILRTGDIQESHSDSVRHIVWSLYRVMGFGNHDGLLGERGPIIALLSTTLNVRGNEMTPYGGALDDCWRLCFYQGVPVARAVTMLKSSHETDQTDLDRVFDDHNGSEASLCHRPCTGNIDDTLVAARDDPGTLNTDGMNYVSVGQLSEKDVPQLVSDFSDSSTKWRAFFCCT